MDFYDKYFLVIAACVAVGIVAYSLFPPFLYEQYVLLLLTGLLQLSFYLIRNERFFSAVLCAFFVLLGMLRMSFAGDFSFSDLLPIGEGIRSSFLHKINNLGLSDETSALLDAMLLGER